MSPIDRSSLVVGTSSTGIACEQSRFPNSPDWIFGLREPSTSGGSQPISSSSPTYRSRSALLRVSIRLGLGSTKCGSWYPLPRDSTEMRSPPTSLASEPSTGMLETTRSSARAASGARAASTASSRIRFMVVSSEGVRAVRADGVLELQVGGVGGGRICRGDGRRQVRPAGGTEVLGFHVRPHPGELAPLPGDAQGAPLRTAHHAGGGNPEKVAAHAEEPVARDLQDDLRVEAAIPSGRDPRAVFQVPPDRFGLPRERVITT